MCTPWHGPVAFNLLLLSRSHSAPAPVLSFTTCGPAKPSEESKVGFEGNNSSLNCCHIDTQNAYPCSISVLLLEGASTSPATWLLWLTN
jgi:hypothetical protein